MAQQSNTSQFYSSIYLLIIYLHLPNQSSSPSTKLVPKQPGKAPRQPRVAQDSPERHKTARTAPDSPGRHKTAQSGTRQPEWCQTAQGGTRQPRAAQDSPERHKTAQSGTRQPRPAAQCRKHSHGQTTTTLQPYYVQVPPQQLQGQPSPRVSQ